MIPMMLINKKSYYSSEFYDDQLEGIYLVYLGADG